MKNREYQICTRCVMDTTDSEIQFDENGVCNHCIYFEKVLSKSWYPNSDGARMLDEIVLKIQAEGKKISMIVSLV